MLCVSLWTPCLSFCDYLYLAFKSLKFSAYPQMLTKHLLCSKHKHTFAAALLLWWLIPQPTVCPSSFHSVSMHSCSPPGPHIPCRQQWHVFCFFVPPHWGLPLSPDTQPTSPGSVTIFLFHLFYHLCIDDYTTIHLPRLLWRLEMFCSGGLSQLMGAMINIIHPSHGLSVLGT